MTTAYVKARPVEPGSLPTAEEVRAMLAAYAEPEGECLRWVGTQLASGGYARKSIRGRTWAVHRLVHEVLIAPVPVDLEVDHLCRNRACVRPEHLEAVTAEENSRRRVFARKTHCVRGHAFTPDNIKMVHQKKGKKRARVGVCRRCHYDRQNANREKRRACARCSASFVELVASTGKRGTWRGWAWFCSSLCAAAPATEEESREGRNA